ncbi:coiled-coil domain-containing protein 137 [Plutella xylostella]|uniref:coiled-coil domain-containing protein 137 n=1 Tax=Plutella xylostella TaxID=51655 RepID=UPI0020323F34|nr:coiled-coil domain-containing protein 137 [Plutella xylostella]
MGRKIPAKKHHGVKDPVKQQAQRMKKLKTQINAPPTDPDDQPMPRSVARLFGLPEYEPKPKKQFKNKKQSSEVNEPKKPHVKGSSKNPVSSLQRLPGESGRSFSLRINSAIRTLNNDRTDDDYPLDMQDDQDIKGTAMAERNERRARKRKKDAGRAAPGEQGEEKASRGRQLTLRKKAKKEKAAEESNLARAELSYERISFGEVAHAPPTLTIKPRKAKQDDGAPRPGRRSLLLTEMLSNKTSTQSKPLPSSKMATGTGKKSKLRELPAVERMRRERARLAAVTAYRQLKKKNESKIKT